MRYKKLPICFAATLQKGFLGLPELDIFIQSELQWGALLTGVLGMFYSHPEKMDEVEFSGDLNNFVSANKYYGKKEGKGVK
jgi:hypothetical protein